jgi:hypothetical protein
VHAVELLYKQNILRLVLVTPRETTLTGKSVKVDETFMQTVKLPAKSYLNAPHLAANWVSCDGLVTPSNGDPKSEVVD